MVSRAGGTLRLAQRCMVSMSGGGYLQLGKRSIEKKNVFFRALPELPNPPPMTPIRATWSSFSEVEIQDLKVSLELRILYILYNILYICNLKNS